MVAAELNYHVTTPSLDSTKTTQFCPIKGVLNSIILHFPNGCNGLVEVQLNLKSLLILPYPTEGSMGSVIIAGVTYTPVGIALNDTTQSFSLHRHVEKKDPLELVILNHDNENEHTLAAVVLLEEELTYAGP